MITLSYFSFGKIEINFTYYPFRGTHVHVDVINLKCGVLFFFGIVIWESFHKCVVLRKLHLGSSFWVSIQCLFKLFEPW